MAGLLNLGTYSPRGMKSTFGVTHVEDAKALSATGKNFMLIHTESGQSLRGKYAEDLDKNKPMEFSHVVPDDVPAEEQMEKSFFILRNCREIIINMDNL